MVHQNCGAWAINHGSPSEKNWWTQKIWLILKTMNLRGVKKCGMPQNKQKNQAKKNRECESLLELLPKKCVQHFLQRENVSTQKSSKQRFPRNVNH